MTGSQRSGRLASSNVCFRESSRSESRSSNLNVRFWPKADIRTESKSLFLYLITVGLTKWSGIEKLPRHKPIPRGRVCQQLRRVAIRALHTDIDPLHDTDQRALVAC